MMRLEEASRLNARLVPMVVLRARGVHGEAAMRARYPAFPQAAGPKAEIETAGRLRAAFEPRCTGPLLRGTSKLGNQLRPDREHPDEKRKRRKRSSFFHEEFQHTGPPCAW